MESKTYIKNIRISPKKLRFLLAEIKRKNPVEALDYLLYTPKRGAGLFHKAISSAISNAKNTLKVSDEALRFKTLIVEQGSSLKRYHPGGRGTIKPFVRRTAHIKIILAVAEKQETKKTEKVVEKKELKDTTKSSKPK